MSSLQSSSEWCKIWLAPTFVFLLKFQTPVINSVNIFQALNLFIYAEILSRSKWHNPCAVTEQTLLYFSYKLCQLWVSPTAIEYLEKQQPRKKIWMQYIVGIKIWQLHCYNPSNIFAQNDWSKHLMWQNMPTLKLKMGSFQNRENHLRSDIPQFSKLLMFQKIFEG